MSTFKCWKTGEIFSSLQKHWEKGCSECDDFYLPWVRGQVTTIKIIGAVTGTAQ